MNTKKVTAALLGALNAAIVAALGAQVQGFSLPPGVVFALVVVGASLGFALNALDSMFS